MKTTPQKRTNSDEWLNKNAEPGGTT